MEQGGQSLRNEDRISELPEALLVQILSSLPTKVVVATSVLSKRWRSLWKTMPSLEFSYNATNDLERFSNNVCRCLLSHQAPVLQSLDLSIDSDNNENSMDCDIGILLGVAFGLHLRELKLHVSSRKLFRFPTSLYNCGTLDTLKLSHDVVIDVPFPVGLKSLRTLHLKRVRYKDDESVVNLLSGCSHLENLDLILYARSGVKTFTIDVPSLQRLIIRSTGEVLYVIKAPSLKYLEVGWSINFDSILIGYTLELEEAYLSISSKNYDYTLGSLTSVKRLCLSQFGPITYRTGSILYRLVYFELRSWKNDWWNLLMFFLSASPKLQVLKLTKQYWSQKAGVKWSQPKNVPECLLLHLQTFVWKGYNKLLEEEKELVKYILRNANHLKRAKFSIKGLNSDERLEIAEELESVVRASNSSCQLLLLE